MQLFSCGKSEKLRFSAGGSLPRPYGFSAKGFFDSLRDDRKGRPYDRTYRQTKGRVAK